MNALVTGGAGYIGSHLVNKLLLDGHKVTVLDHFSFGKESGLYSRKLRKNLSLHKVDISDPGRLKEEYFKDIDWIFHLVQSKRSDVNISRHHNLNVNSTVYLLELARKHNTKKFIYIGAASSYGIPEKNPVPETAAIKPNDVYSLTKFIGEEYVLHWGKIYKLPVIILRLFNVYGPLFRARRGFGNTVSVFMKQKLGNKPFTVFGDGNQLRDFTYITDILDSLVIAAKSNTVQQVINIGSGRVNSVNMLLNLLGGRKIFLKKRPDDPEVIYPDISKAKKMLDWQPKVSLEQGIKLLIKSLDN